MLRSNPEIARQTVMLSMCVPLSLRNFVDLLRARRIEACNGWCQTNSNSSQFLRTGNVLGCKEVTPLGESGCPVQLEIMSA